MVGFGASLAFYVDWLSQHPNRIEIYDLIFRDLGLDILRVGNWYQTLAADAPTVAVVQAAATSLGHAPKLLMSSWSPSVALKSTGMTVNGGTLARAGAGGAYAYAGFGDWWAAALAAYAARGVRPDYISIQNEPEWTATWETCLFGPTEGVDANQAGMNLAGYDRAFEAVYSRVQGLTPIPQLIGPETTGIETDRVQRYLSRLNLAHGGGVAHHLYNGGTPTSPDSFAAPMRAVASVAGAKPVFMTEYRPENVTMFDTAWLVHNAVTVEQVAAYLFWDLTWAPPGGLVSTENPFDRATWTTTRGYVVRDPYYAVKHFARWVDAGWLRVDASATGTAVKASAFTSADGRQATAVLLNTGTTSLNVRVTLTGGTALPTTNVYRTSGTAERTADIGRLGPGGIVTLPGRAIATVTFAP